MEPVRSWCRTSESTTPAHATAAPLLDTVKMRRAALQRTDTHAPAQRQ
jgi:hypothetical protein